jgi:hypothetical protein
MADTFVMSARQAAELDFALERNGLNSAHVKLLSSGSILAEVLQVLEGRAIIVPIPKAKLRRPKRTTPNPAFWQTRPGLELSDNTKALVKQSGHTVRGGIPTGRRLRQNEREYQMFGEPGSPKYEATLENASDFDQIERMLTAQFNGEAGPLDVDGNWNIFPVVLNGALRVVGAVRVGGRWVVYCVPFSAGLVWVAAGQVFSN